MMNGIAMVKKYILDAQKWPCLLKQMRNEQWEKDISWSVIALLVHYLEKNL
jgi:hypothetical protein